MATSPLSKRRRCGVAPRTISDVDGDESSMLGATPLHLSINDADDDGARTRQCLLAEGVEVDARDKKGRTALLWAVLLGAHGSARELLERGASLKAATDENNWTCLHQATQLDDADMVDLLIQHGARVTARDSTDGRTPMHIALSKPCPAHEIVLKLARGGGANMVLMDEFKATALHLAAGNGHTAVVEALCQAGADIEALDSRKETPLHLAATSGQTTTVEALCQLGAEIEARDEVS
ncbi:hypothetical protein CYMTET_2814 [Cymbomonas tetramitiformis]|uniref:Uncharacterized protein n=1 Tax=Cymbomonas tetramitiformis TaxID=36881 RepID=A0AAE0H4E2_9CHLO|nr:hypothetical protein CYMTET_2814 [Cymbomonas tetramitiformis]